MSVLQQLLLSGVENCLERSIELCKILQLDAQILGD